MTNFKDNLTVRELAEAILNDLKLFGNPERKIKIAKDHPTSMQVLGLKVPDQRKIIENWRKKLNHYSEIEWIELAIALVNMEILECQQVAFELIWKNKKALQALNLDQILTLGKVLDNWVSVDMYCMCITGYNWRTRKIQDKIIEQWVASEDRWIRRTALVSTVPLNLRARGGTGDAERTLRICRMLISDHDDMIVKAMSWALRELSKSDKQTVEFFMEEFSSKLHPRIKREVATKLRTGKKNG